jgi:molybdate transport system substrate-binding protein
MCSDVQTGNALLLQAALEGKRRTVLRVGLLGLGVAIGRPSVAADPALRILAAASLKEAFDALVRPWARRSGVPPIVIYGGTPMLARQLEQGAPADLIVSADEAWMDRLALSGLIRRDTRRVLAGNRLVLIAPSRSKVAFALQPGMPIAAALGTGRLAVADVRTVPAGRYARAALESLGVWAPVSDRLAMTDNVRAALALVAREEAPLGIVYATDVRAEPRVRVVGTFDAALHPPIVYPMAVTTASTHPQAMAFLDWLGADEAGVILRDQGLTPSARLARSGSAKPVVGASDAAQS